MASSQNAGGRQLSLQGWASGNYWPKETDTVGLPRRSAGEPIFIQKETEAGKE